MVAVSAGAPTYSKMRDPSNLYAPPDADLSSEPRARGNLARYIIGIGFLLIALRDSFRLLSIGMLPKEVTVNFGVLFIAFTAVLMVSRVVVAIAFFLRRHFAWWLGMALVGYSIGSMIAAMWSRGVISILTAILPLFIIFIPHFAASVRETFDIDRRKLTLGVGLLAVFVVVRAMLPGAPY